jgi:enoyl-CoA hydratase
VSWDVQPLTDNRFVGTLTLNSPSTLNALTPELGRQFQEQCRVITDDITTGRQLVDVVVLVGAGNRAFSAGGDLDWLQSLRYNAVHANVDAMLQFYHYFLSVRTIPVPIICALHGPAMGAGAGLALACDLRTASNRDVILGLHFSRLGIHAGMGSSHYLPQVASAGQGIVNEILLTGKILSGAECRQYGLANRLVDGDAREAAYELARTIAVDQHPVAIRTMVRTLRQQQDVGLTQSLQREAVAQAVCYNRTDWGEGVTAIAAKRDPSFDPYHSL